MATITIPTTYDWEDKRGMLVKYLAECWTQNKFSINFSLYKVTNQEGLCCFTSVESVAPYVVPVTE